MRANLMRLLGVVLMLSTVPLLGMSVASADVNEDQNKIEYWQDQGYGTCVKYEGDALTEGTSFTVPAAPEGHVYTLAVVKAGSGDGANELDTDVKAGDVLTRAGDDKEISHVILCSKPGVQAQAPDVTQAQCVNNVVTTPTYTIKSTPNVAYSVGGVTKAAGTYDGVAGTTITVVATAASGYVLTGPSSFPLVFATASCAPQNATPVTPTFVDSVCVAGGGASNKAANYTIPTTTGVDYYVGATKVAAGTYPAEDGSTITVTAQAQAGYALQGTASFPHTFPTPSCASTTTTTTTDTAVGGVTVGSEDEVAAVDDEVAVEGTKTEVEAAGTGVLAATGAGLSLATAISLSLGLLLAGAALVAAPRLGLARGQHRKG